MKIEPCTKADFDWILDHFDRFWDNDATRPRHHPMFVNEFADTAFVIRDDDTIAAYLFGFVATASPTAYVHMVAVNRAHRRQGLATRLYDNFISLARSRGCKRIKATVAPENRLSIDYHLARGMTMTRIENYSGPGIDRVVFLADLQPT